MHRVSSLEDQDIIRPFRYPRDTLVVFLLGLPVHLFQEVPKHKSVNWSNICVPENWTRCNDSNLNMLLHRTRVLACGKTY